jgi:glycosyltransferase involved in cell wall biosynthesis
MHDMNPFTGGCHVNLNCFRFRDNCGQCPQIGSNDSNDISNKNWRNKKEIYDNINLDQLQIVAPSSWLDRKIQNSSLMGRFRTTVIPNGIDSNLFFPKDRLKCRRYLEIPEKKKIIIFIANSLTVEHKGLNYLLQAVTVSLPFDDKVLILVGNGKPAIEPSIPYIHMNYLDNSQLPAVYSAADILVMPSLQESFGLAAVESLACGTPVVGFDVGGIPDMVRPGVTGLLVPPKDVKALGDAIQFLLQNDELRIQMSKNCRKIAVEEYSLEVQANRYLKLYREMLSRN